LGGSRVTAVLLTIGRYLNALYLGQSEGAPIFGAASSLLALLIWIYCLCAILFYGVEFAKAYRREDHLKVQPRKTAVVGREDISESRPRRIAVPK
jgi:membrane protein